MPDVFVVVDSVPRVKALFVNKILLDLLGKNQPSLQSMLVAFIVAVFSQHPSPDEILHLCNEYLKIHLQDGVWF